MISLHEILKQPGDFGAKVELQIPHFVWYAQCDFYVEPTESWFRLHRIYVTLSHASSRDLFWIWQFFGTVLLNAPQGVWGAHRDQIIQAPVRAVENKLGCLKPR